MFQSTPPHGERHSRALPSRAVGRVSIHAPAWGATQGKGQNKWKKECFNPRPRMGSDLNAHRALNDAILSCFNPRPRMGSDGRYCISLVTPSVSIHAPAWGATTKR